jgi:hypothetical protein
MRTPQIQICGNWQRSRIRWMQELHSGSETWRSRSSRNLGPEKISVSARSSSPTRAALIASLERHDKAIDEVDKRITGYNQNGT